MTTLPFHIARRYIFAKKSHKAVNIISMISLFGFCIGTAALVIVLSVFNGFEGLITGMYNQFDPDFKIVAAQGKSFILTDEVKEQLKTNQNIADFAEVIEEQALVRYNGKQSTALIKGVSDNYAQVTGIDSLFLQGHFNLQKQDQQGAAIGMGLANTLGMGLNFVNTMVIYAPQRHQSISLSNPEKNFKTNYFFPTGFFAVYQPEIDNQYIILDINQTRDLFQYKNEISALELHLKDGIKTKQVEAELHSIFSKDFKVLTRLQQKADLYKMFTMEKWMSFFVVIFILIIAIFNIVGTLSMLIIEKKKDIQTLLSLGAYGPFIRRIFYYEGQMIAFFGACLGLIIGIIACLLQQHWGIIELGASGQFIVDAYPVELLLKDIILIFFTVIIIGSISIYFPVNYICKRYNL